MKMLFGGSWMRKSVCKLPLIDVLRTVFPFGCYDVGTLFFHPKTTVLGWYTARCTQSRWPIVLKGLWKKQCWIKK